MTVSIDDIKSAHKTLQAYISRTPLEYSRSASEWIGTDIFFKFENLQKTGSFKIRGAVNRISQLSKEELNRGIVASSAGNHAQGVAFGASALGVKANIVMPQHSPMVKVMATQGYGANVILHGNVYDESYTRARELEKEKGYTFVHPYEDAEVIAGQGTIGLEILEDLPDLDSIIVPIGGGGLISGISTVIKSLKPKVKVYGVVPDRVPAMFHLFHGTNNVTNAKGVLPTLADGLAVKNASQKCFETYIKSQVDDVICIDDGAIAESIVFLLERAKSMVEGSGAIALAAAAKGQLDLGKKCVVLLSGGNIDLNAVSKVIEKGLTRKGRMTRLSVKSKDRPGVLNQLTGIIAQHSANVLQVQHDRMNAQLEVGETLIEFVLETKSQEHIAQIEKALLELPEVLAHKPEDLTSN